ncbi:ABC transporter permease [Tunicatimonas pelagia]|uniref:ABC transporter permease n=1 Tax=Tunicatimonas pelagia TaxID=931531 RepID=UPI0026668828|nr:ABC transporter permease [Tunicatimonas pelagia]WKN40686.1 permease prefix domain 2-containing transporter [Tunicatimonas pelagia]
MPQNKYPPRWINRFLESFCSPHLLEEVQGDLQELYGEWRRKYGERKANWLYFFHAIKFFRPFAIKRKYDTPTNYSLAMLHNYFLTAWRQVQKSKLHTAINIFGLAVGIAACLVIALTVQHEFSYDRHHPEGDRIYRVTTNAKFVDQWFPNGGVPAPAPHAMRDEFTGLDVVAALHIVFSSEVISPTGASLGKQKQIVITEPKYFEVFSSIQWSVGSPERSLSQPYQVVLTDSQAKKYFGDQEAMGKTLTYFDSLDFVVSGIVQDEAHLTDLSFTEYLSFATLWSNQSLAEDYGLEKWQNTNSNSLAFVKLSVSTTAEEIEQQFPALLTKHIDQTEDNPERTFALQPLSDIHFEAEYSMHNQRLAHKPTLYGLMIVALFLLLIASVNFINLETARAILRSREVGVRKVLGSSRRQLIQQFLGETFFITLLAGGLAILVANFGMEYFAESLPPNLSLTELWLGNGWLLFGIIIGAVSLLAGTYPAWVLSAYSPVFALKIQIAKTSGITQKAYLRKALIVFQFAIAQAFILGTLIVGSQLHYLLNKDLGFSEDAVVHFSIPPGWQDTTQRRFLLTNELRELSSISAVSVSGLLPTSAYRSTRTITYQTDTSEIEVQLSIKEADTSFLSVYGIELLAGRNYRFSDTLNELLINETAVKAFGLNSPSEAIGTFIHFNESKKLPIVGVVSDFHDGTLHDKISPIMIGSGILNMGNVNILLASSGEQISGVQRSLTQVEQVLKKFYPAQPFDYQFFDETIASFYETERQTAKLINVATGLAIFISCLGLLGLVSFTTHQRVKEIGIRKVLGATVTQLIALFSREFASLIIISFVIAAPLAWYFAHRWLADFAYRVDVGLFVFVATLASASVLALLTVGIRSWQAALANPVDSLRNE